MSRPVLFVLAGPNGGGKSSLGGAYLRNCGLDYFSAEDFARQAICDERAPFDGAVQRGWHEGCRRLEAAIRAGQSFAIETTLGGATMPRLVRDAALAGIEVSVWYFGLDSADRHVARVARRAAAGGFPIPEHQVRTRFRRCRENLIALMPFVASLRVFDNSTDREPNAIATPAPKLVLDLAGPAPSAMEQAALTGVPTWAKPVVEAAIQYGRLPTL